MEKSAAPLCFQKIPHLGDFEQAFSSSSVNWLLDHCALFRYIGFEPNGQGLRMYEPPKTIVDHVEQILPSCVGPFEVVLCKVNANTPPFKDPYYKSQLNFYLEAGGYEIVFSNTQLRSQVEAKDVVLVDTLRFHRFEAKEQGSLVMVSVLFENSFNDLLSCLA